MMFASQEQRIVDLQDEANWITHRRYRAHQYPGRIVLFRSERFLGLDDKDSHLKWSSLALAGFSSRDVPGTHLTMFHLAWANRRSDSFVRGEPR